MWLGWFWLACAPNFTECEDCCAYGECDASMDLTDSVSIDFSYISEGNDPLNRYSIRQGFYVMTTEVSQGMFQELMAYSAYEGFQPAYGVGSNHPAYYVNWHMAANLANNLTTRHNDIYGTSLNVCYSCTETETLSVECTHSSSPYACSGYRLPTDIEWEYLARSGTTADFWTGMGDDNGGIASGDACNDTISILDDAESPLLSEFAWFCYTDSTQPIASLQPNGFNLYDIHGNLWEWTNDDFGCTFPESVYEHHCTDVSNTRVGRGGSFSIFPSYTAVGGRFEANGTRRDHSIGFRLLRLANRKKNQ